LPVFVSRECFDIVEEVRVKTIKVQLQVPDLTRACHIEEAKRYTGSRGNCGFSRSHSASTLKGVFHGQDRSGFSISACVAIEKRDVSGTGNAEFSLPQLRLSTDATRLRIANFNASVI
jgi:hypothetical protein